jgi:hypothetical protein
VNVGIDVPPSAGRRVVLVTDGVDSLMNFRNTNSSLKDVMKRAEEEMMFTPIGPRAERLSAAFQEAAASAAAASAVEDSEGGGGYRGAGGR